MVGLGLRVGPGRSSAIAVPPGALDFSALIALPSARRSAVTTAAETAATTIGVSAQSIVDALAVGRGLCSMLPNDGCLMASSGGAPTVQGDPVGAIRSWTGIELATQSNASLRPVSAASGISVDGTRQMALGELSAWTAGEALAVLDIERVGSNAFVDGRFWRIGSDPQVTHLPWTNDQIFDTFGLADNRSEQVARAERTNKFIYQVRASAGSQAALDNGIELSNTTGTIGFSDSALIFASQSPGGFTGLVSALALNPSLYTTDQRAAVREFSRNYFEVAY